MVKERSSHLVTVFAFGLTWARVHLRCSDRKQGKCWPHIIWPLCRLCLITPNSQCTNWRLTSNGHTAVTVGVCLFVCVQPLTELSLSPYSSPGVCLWSRKRWNIYNSQGRFLARILRIYQMTFYDIVSQLQVNVCLLKKLTNLLEVFPYHWRQVLAHGENCWSL